MLSDMDAETQAIIAEHLARYLASGGTDGHFIDGLPALLLTSIGRRSGLPRTRPPRFMPATARIT